LKKVLWLVSWYPNRLDNFDGDFIQRHARAVALYCKVHVIYVKKDGSLKPGTSEAEKFESNNLLEEIIYYNSPGTGIKLLDKFLSYKSYKKHYTDAINKYINELGKPPVVHVHVAMKAGLAALWMKEKWNIPFIITEHWTAYHKQAFPSVYDYNPVFRKLHKKVLKEAEILLPVSKNLGQTINLFLPGTPYQVIPNVVNTAVFNYQPSSQIKFRFIHISYMNFQKNPEGIFIAAQLLKNRGYDFELLMLGNENDSLTALANKYGLLPDTVFFKKAVPYTDVAGFIQNASAFLLFSRFENLPCVLLEALCCGLPVICSNVGGIAEVVNAENGILIESENTAALANAMQKMIDEYRHYNKEKIAADASAKYNYATVGRLIADFYK
jgi:glycosyltransferase involved in cell wall biosynthesis